MTIDRFARSHHSANQPDRPVARIEMPAIVPAFEHQTELLGFLSPPDPARPLKADFRLSLMPACQSLAPLAVQRWPAVHRSPALSELRPDRMPRYPLLFGLHFPLSRRLMPQRSGFQIDQ